MRTLVSLLANAALMGGVTIAEEKRRRLQN